MQFIPPVSYQDLIAIILTALGVILAALGVIFTLASVVLAALAFAGYQNIISSAKKHIEAIISKYPTPEVFQAQATAMLNQIVKDLASSDAVDASQMTVVSSKPVVQSPVAAESSAPISAPYPNKEVSDGPNEDTPAK